jgi:hypothetical protein
MKEYYCRISIPELNPTVAEVKAKVEEIIGQIEPITIQLSVEYFSEWDDHAYAMYIRLLLQDIDYMQLKLKREDTIKFAHSIKTLQYRNLE